MKSNPHISTFRGFFAGVSMQATALVAMVVVHLPQEASAALVAIVRQNESTGLEIANHLSSLETAAGNTSSIFTSVPADLSGFDQLWDLRYFDAITAPVEAQYLSFLQSGRPIFAMGENSNAIFTARNTSMLNFVNAAGGGSLNFTTPASTQTVLAPFNTLIPGSTVTYIAPGGVTSAGTGQFMTQDGGGVGSAVAWNTGTLSNATPGALGLVFDLNFMRPIADANSQQLVKNIITFMNDSANPPIPEPGTALFGLALLGVTTLRRSRR